MYDKSICEKTGKEHRYQAGSYGFGYEFWDCKDCRNRVPYKVKEEHNHVWDTHCNCTYCKLEMCLTCGEERKLTTPKVKEDI